MANVLTRLAASKKISLLLFFELRLSLAILIGFITRLAHPRQNENRTLREKGASDYKASQLEKLTG